MVDRKAIGYAIELVVAMLIFFSFVIGGMHLQGDKTYADYRVSTTAHDIDYISHRLGYTDEIAVRGQTGTLETFIDTITDRRLLVSGSIRGMPFQDEISIGFHTDSEINSNTFDNVDNNDQCYGNLDTIEVYHNGDEDEILINQDDNYQDRYNATLYLAETGESSEYNYDALFVDRGRDCDFTDGGPFYLDEIFMWGDTESQGPIHFYEFREGIDNSGNEPLFYNATQVKRFQEAFQKPVNNLQVNTDVETFGENDESDQYDLMVFRGEFDNDPQNYEQEFSNSSALYLENVTGTGDSVLEILDNNDYDSVSSQSGVQNILFPEHWAAQNLKDYYMAMDNEGYVRYPAGGDVEVYDAEDKALAKDFSEDISVVNHWTTTESNFEIQRIARTGYLEYPNYTQEQIDFIVAISYWLTEEEEQFNHEIHDEDLIPTESTGVAGENKETPYQLSLRWSR